MAQGVPNLCVSRKVFLKHQVNWNTVCGAIQDLSWRNIWIADNPVEVFERKSVPGGCALCTMQPRHPCGNKDKPWFDVQCRHAFWPQSGMLLAILFGLNSCVRQK